MYLMDQFAGMAANYISGISQQPVFPSADSIAQLEHFREPLQQEPVSPDEVLHLLDQLGSPATVKSSGGRYFGFVTGSSLPAAMITKLLATVWDQNGAMYVMSPVAATLEEIASDWMIDLLGLPKGAATGFVTGATMANFTALAAARHALLARAGWDVEAKGLFGAPEIQIVVGDEVHVSLLKALSLVGFGRERIIRVPVDHQGRIQADKIPWTDAPTILCLQAGNVNTGAFDPFEEICRNKKENVWIHIDGAFGLWAAASPATHHLVKGMNGADSWAADAHKWLNAPYDCGLVFVKEKVFLFDAMASSAAYLVQTGKRDPFQFTPEMSRETRGVPIWAALKSLGKQGLAHMIQGHCQKARYMAKALQDAGFRILNEVVLNQVLVSFGDEATTLEVIKKIQEEGTCWCGGTNWQGNTAMRISISSWATTDQDIQLSIDAIVKIARRVLDTQSKQKPSDQAETSL